MNKKTLMAVIPDHGEVAVDADSVTIDGVCYLLWGLYRDGSFIWVDIEDSERCGRWWLPFVDLPKKVIQYIYYSVSKHFNL